MTYLAFTYLPYHIYDIIFPILIYCQLESQQQMMKFESKYDNFHSRKYINKFLVQNGGHFVPILFILTHCDLVTPYGDIDLSQHWLW